MKKSVAGFLLAVLAWTNGPLPAFAAQAVGRVASVGVYTPLGGQAATGTRQTRHCGPALHVSKPAGLSAPAAVALPGPSRLLPQRVVAAAPASSIASHILAEAAALDPVQRLESVAAPIARKTPATDRARDTLLTLHEQLAQGKPSDPSGPRHADALDNFFDGIATRRQAESITISAQPGHPLSDAPSKTRSAAPESQAKVPQRPAQDPPKTRLPFSYYLYLIGQFLYALGQEATSLIAPLYAYSAQGLAFAVASQALFLVAILPGSFLGAKWIKRFDAKKVYLAGNILHGLFALSVPVLHVLTGAFSPLHFLASNIITGFIYGSLRGVAEKEIAPRILGQEDRGRLNRAGALFYAAFEGAELIAALLIMGLIPFLGLNPTAAIMSAVMLASAVPIWFMQLKKAAPGDEAKGGIEKRLPKMLYLPYIFSVFSHLSLYMLLAPFLALEIFHKEALNSTIVACYTVGSLLVALVTAYASKLTGKLSERHWAALGVASMLVFMAAALFLQSQLLTLGAAFLLGIGLTAMQVQWRSLYQQRLDIAVQPTVFQWLSILGVVATLPAFTFMQAGIFLGWPMPLLLTAVAAAIAVVSLGVPLCSWLVRRFKLFLHAKNPTP
ncbi:MAG TPA: hypothetical protein DEB40_06470 [Elusimicrobia bacterium]|nr:hypothetical protein [Elusimicrobiota bacterium]HBT61371.1 hypothetical protein [Elusimicrobiota bacterium]